MSWPKDISAGGLKEALRRGRTPQYCVSHTVYIFYPLSFTRKMLQSKALTSVILNVKEVEGGKQLLVYLSNRKHMSPATLQKYNLQTTADVQHLKIKDHQK